jgi:hypothetical protein
MSDRSIADRLAELVRARMEHNFVYGAQAMLFTDPMNHYTLEDHHKPGLQRIYDAYQDVARVLNDQLAPNQATPRKQAIADGLADSRAAAVRCYLMTWGTPKVPSAEGFSAPKDG